MPVTLPDPSRVAQQEAARINENRELALVRPIERVLADSPFVDREQLVAGLDAFHAERMSKIPSPALYPESPPWVAHALAADKELQRLANLTDSELAGYRSLHLYLCFRGFKQAARMVTADEKCRVAYAPDTDRGEAVIKNVDDPLKHWKRVTDKPCVGLLPPLRSDGVGNGLHMDDEPDELFPLNPLAMLQHYCTDVPSAVQFLTRYCKFWGRANMLFHDAQKRAVAIEKCSYKYIEVFHPGPDGGMHISGMTCRDPNSPQGKHQAEKRRGYLKAFHQPADCADNAFWAACAKFEQKLSTGLKNLGVKPRFADLVKLFTTDWPQGLNKAGLRIHPDQGLIGYTLMTHATLITERKFLRWQRSEDGKTFDAEPEVFAI